MLSNSLNWSYFVEEVEKIPSKNSTKRNTLYDCVTAAYHIHKSKDLLDSYLEDFNDVKRAMDFTINDSIFCFSLCYYRDHSNTSDKKDIQNIISLTSSYQKTNHLMFNKKIDEVKAKEHMRSCIILMAKGINHILKEEISNWSIGESITGVEDRLAYLANLSDISKTDLDKLKFLDKFICENF